MSAHTPGPWIFEPRTGLILDADGNALAFASAAHASSLQNGPVLAAAPELLAALREIAEGCMNLRPGHVDADKNRTKAQIEGIARAAIAKATEAA